MPDADVGPPRAIPSVSGVPVPSRYFSDLPAADQPLVVSVVHTEPFHSSRSRAPAPLSTAQRTPGVALPLPS